MGAHAGHRPHCAPAQGINREGRQRCSGTLGSQGDSGLPGAALRRTARYISVNPAEDVQLPRKTTPEKTALTHDQVRQHADAAGDLRTMVYVLAYGGLRYGECAALRCGDVDITRRRLVVSRSATAVAKLGMVETDTKTHQARAVPLPAFAMAWSPGRSGVVPPPTWCSLTMTGDGYPAIGSPSGWRRPAPLLDCPASAHTRCATPPARWRWPRERRWSWFRSCSGISPR